jgi:DNA polymerase sigma
MMLQNNNNMLMNINAFQNQQSQKNNYLNNAMSTSNNSQISSNLNNNFNNINNLNLFNNNNLNLFNNYFYQNNYQTYNSIFFNYWSDENNLLSNLRKNTNNNKSNYHNKMTYIKYKSDNLFNEYIKIQKVEKENPSIIEENLKLFEEKIILPVYVKINEENQEKKDYYTEIYNKYKNIIIKILSKYNLEDTLVEPYGSIVNNFMTEWGDMDICIVPKDNNLINNFLEYLKEIKEEAVDIQKIAKFNILEKYPRFLILKLIDVEKNIDLDITVQNILPIQNTKLIRLYSLLDQRFHILGIFLKFWVKKNHIHGALEKFLSSYALLILIIHYLQNITEPKILPILQEIQNIQKEYKYFFEDKEIKTNLYFEENLDKINNYMNIINDKNENNNSVVELLIGFFHFYAYEYNHYLISISHSDKKQVAEDDTVAFPLEDPFDINYNPGKSLKLNTLQYTAFIYCLKKELNNILSGEYFKFGVGE